MQSSLALAQIHYPSIAELRRVRTRLRREDELTGIIESARLIDQAWPLFAAGMEGQALPRRILLDTPGRRVLYKLAHPDFDETAAMAYCRRLEEGRPYSPSERQTLIDRLQAEADRNSDLFDRDACPGGDVSEQTRGHLGSLSATRRFELMRDHQNQTTPKSETVRVKALPRAESKLTVGQWQLYQDRQKWDTKDLLQPLAAMSDLVNDLLASQTHEIIQGFIRYGASSYERRHRHASAQVRAEVLAACIAAAERAGPTSDTFICTEAPVAEIRHQFHAYQDALKAARRKSKMKNPRKSLIIAEFQKRR